MHYLEWVTEISNTHKRLGIRANSHPNTSTIFFTCKTQISSVTSIPNFQSGQYSCPINNEMSPNWGQSSSCHVTRSHTVSSARRGTKVSLYTPSTLCWHTRLWQTDKTVQRANYCRFFTIQLDDWVTFSAFLFVPFVTRGEGQEWRALIISVFQ